MERLFEIVAINALGATLLALAAALISRRVRRPGVAHLVWLVVLLELVSPPVWQVAVLPRLAVARVVAPSGSGGVAGVARNARGRPPSSVAATVGEPSGAPTEAPGSPGPLGLALAVWLLVAAGLSGLALERSRRFRRLLRDARDGDAALTGEVASLANRLGLRRAPRVRVVPARISPMLWFRPGAPELLLPAGLVARLGRDELRTVLAHELAHVRRRDHWTRLFELVVGCLFWWHPVSWWARRALRRAEERCCDAWVVRALPRHAGAYARALVKTVEYLSRSDRTVPALASGIGQTSELKERLIMILERSPRSPLTRPVRVLSATAVVALLLVFPTWADLAPSGSTATLREEPPAELRRTLLDLEREAIRLEQRLREVRLEQRRIEGRWREERDRREATVLEEQALRLEAEGARSEAERARARATAMQQISELQRERELLRMDLEQRMAMHEDQIRELELIAERSAVEGEEQAARELREQLRRMKREIHRDSRDSERELQHVERELERRLADLEESARELRFGREPEDEPFGEPERDR